MLHQPTFVHLPPDEIEQGGQLIARAFAADPLAVYTCPEPQEYTQRMPWHFSASIRYGHLFGEAITTAGHREALGVWFPPGATDTTPERLAQAGIDQAPQQLGAAAADRFATVSDYIDGLHAEEMVEPHWYVWLLAVDPQRQEQGVGAALLRSLTTRAAAQEVPVYLWTVQPKSVPFYEHLGFQVVTHAIEPTSQLPFWTFRRNPKP